MSGWTPVTEDTLKSQPSGWTPVDENKAGFGQRFLESSGFSGLAELSKNLPQSFSDLLSIGTGPAKQAASAAMAPMKHLSEIIAAHKAGDKEGVVSGVGKFIDSFVPGTGNAQELTQNTLKDIQQGNVAGISGTATGLATQLALTKPLLKEAGAVRTSGMPERLYQSALKPSTTLPPAKVAGMVKTGLESEIPVSAAGAEKLGSLIDDLNAKITAKVQQSGATVNKYAVASRLGETAQEFSQQVNPAKDLNAISRSGNEFLKMQPTEIPATQAQAIKQGTYQQIRKSYGQMSNATVESQKALARGIKEELATQIPEIGDLNAKESALLGLDKAMERAVGRIGNLNMMGIGTPIAAGAAGAITGRSSIGVISGIVKAVIDDPIVKSKIAIAMAKHGSLAQAASRLAAYSAALGKAASASVPAGQGSEQTNGR